MLEDLAKHYGKSIKTLQALFDQSCFTTGEIPVPDHPVSLSMDATYFKRTQGVLLARVQGKNLTWLHIKTETAEVYERLINVLISAGVQISAFVIDGKRGIRQMLQKKYPYKLIQQCQFHQIQTITHYLTKNPKLEAGKQLRKIALDLKYCGKSRFTRKLRRWHNRWENFLNERTTDESKRGWHYSHKRLRSAYRSLNSNLTWLFTFLEYPELKIPNTTNGCDGYFSHFKNKLNVHRGLRKDRKQKMIDYLLENS